jgi:hypothetical protein
MKKTLLMLALGAFLIPAGAFAQDTMKPSPDQGKAMAKSVKVVGKISDDGKSFVSDKDGKTWTIDNPDAVKGHEGHHVVLSANPDAASSTVHVNSLKMAKDTMSKDGSKM